MRIRATSVAVISTLMLLLSGCLFETTLNEQGGGTMKVELRANQYDTLPKVKSRFESPNVEITNATMDDKKNAVIELKYKDFTKLSTSAYFNNVDFALTRDAAAKTQTASATVKYEQPVALKPEQLDYYGKEVHISLTVPGEVVKTDGTANGKTVTWTVDVEKLLKAKSTPFSVTFKSDAPAPAATASAATPAGSPAPDATPAQTPSAKAGSSKKKKK